MRVLSKIMDFMYGELPPNVTEEEWDKLSQEQGIPKWLAKFVSRGIYNQVKNTADILSRCTK